MRAGMRQTVGPTKPAGAPSGSAGVPATHPLATPLQFLKGVGPQRAKLLANLGLQTVEDALYYLPDRHEDRSQLTPLRSLKPDDVTTVTGTIRAISPPPRNRPRVPLSVLLSDGTGYLSCVWFGQAYLERLFQRGQRLIVHGKAQRYRSADAAADEAPGRRLRGRPGGSAARGAAGAPPSRPTARGPARRPLPEGGQ